MEQEKRFKYLIKIIFRGTMVLFCIGVSVVSVSASDFIDRFAEKYDNLVPRANSSVNSDYLFEQMSVGSYYTVKALDGIYEQNRILLEKHEVLLEKYETIIRQNNDIIGLLKKIADRPGNDD